MDLVDTIDVVVLKIPDIIYYPTDIGIKSQSYEAYKKFVETFEPYFQF